MNLIKEDVVQLNSYIFFINMLLVSKTGALETGLRGNPVQIGNGPATVISRSSLYYGTKGTVQQPLPDTLPCLRREGESFGNKSGNLPVLISHKGKTRAFEERFWLQIFTSICK